MNTRHLLPQARSLPPTACRQFLTRIARKADQRWIVAGHSCRSGTEHRGHRADSRLTPLRRVPRPVEVWPVGRIAITNTDPEVCLAGVSDVPTSNIAVHDRAATPLVEGRIVVPRRQMVRRGRLDPSYGYDAPLRCGRPASAAPTPPARGDDALTRVWYPLAGARPQGPALRPQFV